MTPQGRLTAYAKLRGSLDGSSVAWWFRGTQYGVVDLQPQRLWAMQGLQVASLKVREDGSYENIFRELLFYQDPHTGEFSPQIRNPYTQKMVNPGPQRMGPMTLIYSRAGAAIKDTENVPEGLDTDWRVDRALVSGDDLALHEEGYSRVMNGQLPIVLNDFITLHGSLSEVSDPETLNARSRYSSTTMSTWPQFMNMGGHEGYALGRGNGYKLRSRADIDPNFLAAVLAEAPEWLDDVIFADD